MGPFTLLNKSQHPIEAAAWHWHFVDIVWELQLREINESKGEVVLSWRCAAFQTGMDLYLPMVRGNSVSATGAGKGVQDGSKLLLLMACQMIPDCTALHSTGCPNPCPHTDVFFRIFRAKRWMHYLHTCYMLHPAHVLGFLSSSRYLVKSATFVVPCDSYDPLPSWRRYWDLAFPVYSPVVTICTAQWSLYLPYSGHYMYRTVVSICTASLTFNNSTFCPHSCIYVFYVDLRTNSDYFPIQH
jgi:hypothetical protein